MKIWLVQTWEPNPLDDPKLRPWRTGMLAQRLVLQGHEVTWWASNFSHVHKKFRSESPSHALDQRLTIRLIPALGYRRHVSLARLRDHQHVARAFGNLAEQEPKPDVIVASFPTIEICHACAGYAKKNNVPLLMDIRDQYPDLYWENAPSWARAVVYSLCHGARRQARTALAAADGITANGPGVVQWGLNYAGRAPGAHDRSIFMSYEPPHLDAADRAAAESHWDEAGIRQGAEIAVYAGMLGQTIDFQAIERLAVRFPELQVVLAGVGDRIEDAKALARAHPNVRFTGWLDTAQLKVLLERATLGLVPYLPRQNFETGITNKPIEYLANGLPILTTLERGTLVDLIKEHDAGISAADWSGDLGPLQGWLQHPEKMDRARFQARSLYEKTFHPDVVYGDWIALIHQLVSDRAVR